ncbi:MAG: hypothetical protein J5935_02995 [Lachnospiraceae bacterium]|nr:hypothetical protein [Lachnospiraceae bacterium]
MTKKRIRNDALAGALAILLSCACGICGGVFLGKAIVGWRHLFPKEEKAYELLTADVPLDVTEEELLRQFCEAQKDGFTMREKVDLLSAAMHREFSLLGIRMKPQLDIEFLEGSRQGYCEVRTGRIVLDAEHVRDDSLEACLQSLFHECRHCYQWQMVRLYDKAPDDLKALRLFRDADTMRAEFADYVTADEDEWEYYTQRCEQDARQYGEERVRDWIKLVKTAVAF